MHYDPLRLGPCPKDLSEWTSLPPPNNTPPTYNNTHKHNNSCHTRIRVPISTASAVHPACQAAAHAALDHPVIHGASQRPHLLIAHSTFPSAHRSAHRHAPPPCRSRTPATPAAAIHSLYIRSQVTIHTSHSLHIYSQVITIRTTSSRTPLPAVACQVAHAPSHSSRDILHHSTSDIRPASHCTTHARSDSLSPQAVVE